MKTYIYNGLILVCTLFLFVPSIVSAKWWNPKSWVQPETQYVEKIVEKPVEVEKIVEKIVEKPVEKIVIKTVDNPDQSKKIEELSTKIIEKDKEIAILSKKVDSMVQMVKDLGTYGEQNITKVADYCKATIDKIYSNFSTYNSYSNNQQLNSAVLQYVNNQNAQYEAQQQSAISSVCNDMTSRRYAQSTDSYCKSLGR